MALMRASDDFRERTVERLGAGYADGLLGFDTLCHRVDRAYSARTVEQLRALVRDLPAPTGVLREALVAGCARLVVTDDRWDEQAALLSPPARPGACFVIGRDPDC